MINCWAAGYTAFSEVIRLGRENSVASNEFRKNAEDLGMERKFGGIAFYSSIGKGKGFQHPLDRIFHIIQETRHN